MKTASVIFFLLFGFNSFASTIAGNGEVGSAEDGVFSRTTTLHEPHNEQNEAIKMADLCKALEAQEVNPGSCRVQCNRASENVFVMSVSKEGFDAPVAVEFQPNDMTLMTFWGSALEHEYLNSKNIYMEIMIYKSAHVTLNIKKDQDFVLSCGTIRAH